MTEERINEVLASEYIPGDSVHTGLGINNLLRRLKLCYGTNFQFAISLVPTGGTSIRFCLPIEVNDDENDEIGREQA